MNKIKAIKDTHYSTPGTHIIQPNDPSISFSQQGVGCKNSCRDTKYPQPTLIYDTNQTTGSGINIYQYMNNKQPTDFTKIKVCGLKGLDEKNKYPKTIFADLQDINNGVTWGSCNCIAEPWLPPYKPPAIKKVQEGSFPNGAQSFESQCETFFSNLQSLSKPVLSEDAKVSVYEYTYPLSDDSIEGTFKTV